MTGNWLEFVEKLRTKNAIPNFWLIRTNIFNHRCKFSSYGTVDIKEYWFQSSHIVCTDDSILNWRPTEFYHDFQANFKSGKVSPTTALNFHESKLSNNPYRICSTDGPMASPMISYFNMFIHLFRGMKWHKYRV